MCEPTERLADFVFQHAPIGLVATRHRLIETCSPAFAQMFGYAPEELTGKSIALLYPSTKEFVDIGQLGWGTLKDSRPYNDNRIMKRRDGAQFWCQVHGKSVTPRNPFAHCVWSFVDLSDHRPVADFTRRERQIAMLIVEGLSNKQIGQRLGISHRTVEAHRSRMMTKTGATTSTELLFAVAGLPA